MKWRLLFVISLTVLAGTARAGAEELRGLSTGPSAERPPAAAPGLVFAQKQTNPEPGELFRDCPDCPELVVVPSGDFVMGSNDTPYEKPERTISIKRPFAIGRREVTFAEWDQCADAGTCKYKPEDHGWGRGDRPAINVSWDDAKLYVGWLSQKTGQKYRLPSETEWEYAARAGTKTPFWWGKDAGSGHAQCDNCGSLLKPTELIESRSALSEDTALEVRQSLHLFLRQSLLVDELREWVDSRTGWPPFVVSFAKS